MIVTLQLLGKVEQNYPSTFKKGGAKYRILWRKVEQNYPSTFKKGGAKYRIPWGKVEQNYPPLRKVEPNKLFNIGNIYDFDSTFLRGI